ncbi:MAG TPA: c-type cytochrome [Isosphaeraceae bacterium]|nr:c-type cytochrome [Isosphaeraceae bacterium]
MDPPRHLTGTYDDAATGGQLFQQYCGSCHNARPLGERPFSNYHVALTHMRDQAYLTGKEYRQIMYFLRRWDDVGPPTPTVEPSPKRLIFSQPISELRNEPPAAGSGSGSGSSSGSGAPAAPPPPGSGPWAQPGAVAPPAASGTPRPPQAGASGGSPAQPLPPALSAPNN